MTQTTSKRANRALWTAQILLALLFLMAGVSKLALPVEKLQGPIDLPLTFVRFIGVCETLGALGLILPGLLHIRTTLTPLAASGLVIIMVGATVLSVLAIGVGAAILPFVTGIIACTIAYARWRVVPLREGTRRHVMQTA